MFHIKIKERRIKWNGWFKHDIKQKLIQLMTEQLVCW